MDGLLNDLIASARKQNLHIRNVVVRQGGTVIARHDFFEDQPRLLYSASKTFTSMAAGVAMAEGRFRLDGRVAELFSDIAPVQPGPYLSAMTVRDLLCMGTGHAACPVMKADWGGSQRHDIARLFFDEPVVFPPGTHFTYDNSATYMLSLLIRRTTGEDLDGYLYRRVLRPLGMDKPRWDRCPLGVPQGFSGLWLTAEQVSRFAELLLRRGAWAGEQLIPSGYVDAATAVQISTADFCEPFATADHHAGYGYQLWRNSYHGSCRLDGLYGQYAVLLPDKDATVVYLCEEPKHMTTILELTWSTLVEKL